MRHEAPGTNGDPHDVLIPPACMLARPAPYQLVAEIGQELGEVAPPLLVDVSENETSICGTDEIQVQVEIKVPCDNCWTRDG